MDMKWNKMIESHLNSSLELEGITVSEDLIQKTLMKIKEQSVEQQIDKIDEVQTRTEIYQGKKKISWVLKLVPTIAAAALLLFIGMNAKGMKISMNESTSNDMALEKKTEMSMDSSYNNMIVDQEDAGARQENTSAPITGLGAMIEENEKSDEVSKETTTMGITAAADLDPLETQNDIFHISFSDISPIALETATSIDITDGSSNNSLFLSSKEDMKQFFDIINEHYFAEGTKGSGKVKFIVRIAGEGVSFTIKLDEEAINTNLLRGEEKVEGRYEAFDQSVLLAQLEQLYLQFNQ